MELTEREIEAAADADLACAALFTVILAACVFLVLVLGVYRPLPHGSGSSSAACVGTMPSSPTRATGC